MEFKQNSTEFPLTDGELYKLSKETSLQQLLKIVVEAEVPVPDHLRDRSKELATVSNLKISQKIGIVLFLLEMNPHHENLCLRLAHLQSIASLEAILSGVRFRDRLKNDEKFVSDNRHNFFYFLSKFFSRRDWRKPRLTRIRGYRDKGTLPDQNLRSRRKAQKESYMSILPFDEKTVEFLKENLPSSAFEGDQIDLTVAREFLNEEFEVLKRLRKLLES